jgi:quercetin dioxygenase-like cupin family protein
MSQASPVVVGSDEGEDLFFGGGRMTFKVTSAQTGGAFAVVEDRMPRGKTTPLHIHPTFDETIYVLEGELLVHVDGVEFTLAAGGIAAATRGSAHAFLVTSEEARVVVFITPGDVAERFFREGGDVPKSKDEPPPPIDIDKVTTAGMRTGAMQVLGPPPFAQVAAGRR